jgi:hypothetical protein
MTVRPCTLTIRGSLPKRTSIGEIMQRYNRYIEYLVDDGLSVDISGPTTSTDSELRQTNSHSIVPCKTLCNLCIGIRSHAKISLRTSHSWCIKDDNLGISGCNATGARYATCRASVWKKNCAGRHFMTHPSQMFRDMVDWTKLMVTL